MSRLLSAVMAAVTLSSGFAALSVSADDRAVGVVLYVSPSGDDSAAGTLGAPLRTLEGARDAVRELRRDGDPEGGITVYLREGVYYQPQTLELTEEDSATEACPITYAAYNGESVTVTGGYSLDPSKFTETGDDVKARLVDKKAKEKVLAYDLKAEGLDYSYIATNLTGGTRIDSRLYYDGLRGWTGRYPNDDRAAYAYVQFGEDFTGDSFIEPTGRVAKWSKDSIAGARMYGNFSIDYETSNGKVTGYDPKTDRVTFSSETSTKSTGRFFYYNVIEEIDSVGEYYIDEDTGMLYFYAPDNYRDIDIRFAVCRDNVISAKVDYYTFDGLTIECGVDNNMLLEGDKNTVQNCLIRDCTDAGIRFVGSGTTIFNNELYHIGGTAVSGRMPNTVYMTHSGTLIDNNLIHDYAEIYRTYNAGIGIGEVAPGFDGGYGMTVTHNEIYNGPHLALSYLCRDALFEYNYIHNVCYEAGDAGAVYDGTWLSNGMVFRNNVIKDINNKFNKFMNPRGYYCDDSGGGKSVYSNIIVNVDGTGIATSGQDNDIHDNILIYAGKEDGKSSIYTDSRSYYKLPGAGMSGWTTSAIFNVSSLNGLWAWLMHPGLNPAYGVEQWAYRYPWTMLLKTTNVYDREDRFVSYAYGDSKVRQNMIYPSSHNIFTTPESRELIYFRDNYFFDSYSEFGFADANGGDYTVADNAPIFELYPGFKPCDFANVGRREVAADS